MPEPWDEADFAAGESMPLPPEPDDRRDVAVTLLQQRRYSAALQVAYRAIDRYHDKTFDNIVSGEATRLFVFERASVSAFITAADALLSAEAPGHALSRLREVFLRLDADRPGVWEHAPVEARVWLDTALCTLVLLRAGNGELDLAEATELLAFYRGQHARLPVPGELHGDLTEGLAECGPDDYDPFTYASRLRAGLAPVHVPADARTEFASELERMGRQNLGYIPKQAALIAALEPDIRRGAAFVNIFKGDTAPLLVITSLNVWVVTLGLFGTKVKSATPLHSITDVAVERRPFRECLGIHLVLSSDAGEELDYQFAFVCSRGYQNFADDERLRIAANNAAIAAQQIERELR